VRDKLKKDKDSAFLSKTLGTICLTAPIETDIESYVKLCTNTEKLKRELARHEMFKLMSRLKLDEEIIKTEKKREYTKKPQLVTIEGLSGLINSAKPVYLELTGNTIYINIGGEVFYVKEKALDAFKLLAENADIPKGFADIKRHYKTAVQNGFAVNNAVFDIRLAAYLLNPNTSSYSVTDIAMSYNIPIPEIETDETGEILTSFKEAAVFSALSERLSALLTDNGQLSLLTDMEIPLAKVLSSMENEGMEVNRENIESFSVVLQNRIEELEKDIYVSAGEKFNINSPKQLGVILFEKLGLPSKKKTKTGYSTNAEVLEGLADDYPIVALILEYRTYSKLKSTYCDGLLKTIEEDGRIHSTFNQTETRTGRLSSTEPNLQNIPVRTSLGREFRKFFTARDGFTLVDADYSQIELRVLAALSNDKNMIDCFNNGVDIHTVTAAKVFGIPENEVTSELRSRAKAVNFGIVYGIGAFSLAKDIHSTRTEAEQFIKSYLALYSSVDSYMKDSIESAKKLGYAKTLFNRRRYLPELTSSNGMLRSFGERVARNMPIQGTAADIIKIAMIKVYDRLEKELPDAKLIMQVHDELIIEAPVLLASKAAAILKEEMENAVKLSVKLSADAGIGKTWYEAKS